MAPQVLVGTWEEIELQADQLRGKRVCVTVVSEERASLSGDAPFHQAATPTEWSQALREWAESHARPDTPLSDAAISRESIYGEQLDALSR